MSDISKIKVSDVEYDIKDAQAREDLTKVSESIANIEKDIYEKHHILNFTESGNQWFKFKIVKGHTYVCKNTSTGNYSLSVHTVNDEYSYEYIEFINNGVIQQDFTVNFTAEENAEYIVCYCNGAGSFEIYEETTFFEMSKRISESEKEIVRAIEENRDLTIEAISGKDMIEIPFVWERGGINHSNGADWSNPYSVRTKYFKCEKDMTVYLKRNKTNACTCVEYNPSKVFVQIYGVTTDRTVPFKKGNWYRIWIYSSIADGGVIPLDGYVTEWLDINLINPLADKLPEYYTEEWLNDSVTRARNVASVETGVSFAFITDMHMTRNSRYTQYLVEKIYDNVGVNTVICGGDIPMAYTSIQGSLSTDAQKNVEISIGQYNAFDTHLREIGMDVFFCKGNHDFSIVTSPTMTDTGWTMPDRFEHNQIMGKNTRKVHGVGGKNYYYYDDETEKVRFIIVDQWETNGVTDYNNNIPYGSGYYNVSSEQYEWLINKALNVDGYTVVVIAHASPNEADKNEIDSTTWVAQDFFNLMKAFKNKTSVSFDGHTADFTNNTSELACIVVGHSHKDYSRLVNNVLTIATTCDSYAVDEAGVTRTIGTTSEHAFDVFGIDTTSRRIRTARIGCGSDREWSY